MTRNSVEILKEEYDSLSNYLSDNKEISLLNDLSKSYRKILLLSASSYFEFQITQILSDFARSKSNHDDRLINFLVKQAISKKYHTLFTWGETDNLDKPQKTANTFFRLFGDNFKIEIEKELKHSNEESQEEKNEKIRIKESIEAFLEIGHHRNILVHSNIGDYNYEQKTADEIFSLFKKAEPFLVYITTKLG